MIPAGAIGYCWPIALVRTYYYLQYI